MDLNVILRTSLLLAAAGIIARLLRHAAPATRHLVWHTAIVLVLLAPALAPLAPTFTVPRAPLVPNVPMVRQFETPAMVTISNSQARVETRTTTIGSGTLGTIGTMIGAFLERGSAEGLERSCAVANPATPFLLAGRGK